ncbi:nitrate ABC transporter permease [Rivihabitans pingtungensis]|jgi:nitrate/nitrite transport system permease protein|uniref:Nitrate/nitrite transport system permease protein n=2 Tax=Pseudomonadota TaxID=1224 RepID=A0A318KMH3_9NEIS|nr:nitrate ABC transporter permease [Rivihabitans pingtungensis]MCK6436222.1 nitrate ABC transporter permease [Rivihabitans pingtungensis]PXX77045.1 nitrate/nitrite transport system permease protein [Rivihabitans pingtungensis]HNX71585.1 nitrate ABC transporter permease [Rivihabitans pingtungensis]
MTQSATVTVDAKASAHSAAAPAAAKPAAAPAARPAAEASPGIDWRELIGQRIIPPILGFALFIAVWAAVAQVTKGIPGPSSTFVAAVKLFSDPFYIAGPNDVGIGWKILNSLSRVGLGFGLAALVGIPAGFLLGRFMFLNRMLSPVIGLLRPVSPLAWLPIGLLVFKAAQPAAIWVIFISSIWPIILNTAAGVSTVPQDYLNVARVLKLSEWKVFTTILFPSVLPHLMTGIRLSIGVAWLVIVAAEMLTGGVGLGFWVWDEWNNLNVEHIIVAIFVVGLIGLALEQGLMMLARRFQYN